MATDPVEQIQAQDYETGLTLDLEGVLNRLAALPPSVEPPYLTLSLDWQPEGSNPRLRPGKLYFDQNRDDEFLATFEAHTPAHESLQADLERAEKFLEEEVPAEAQGVYIVACSGRGVFHGLPLGLPVPTRMTAGPTPALWPLARLADDHPTYAVLLADQQQATLSIITHAYREHSVHVEGSGYPVHQKQGGWSQRRYQDRASERIEAFARTVAEETRQEMDRAGIEMLVVAGDEVILPVLDEEAHQSVKERIVGKIHLQIEATPREVIDATLPLVEQAEREREVTAARNVRDQVGSGASGVAGAEDVLTALQGGQVMTLVMNDDFSGAGWADFSFPVYGVGEPPAEHPLGGDAKKIVPIALEEEVIRLAVQSGADVEIVKTSVPVSEAEQMDVPDADEPMPRSEAAKIMDELGGVGAVLRFALEEGQSTANL